MQHLLAVGRRVYLADYGAISFADRRLGMEHWVDGVVPAAVQAASADAAITADPAKPWPDGGGRDAGKPADVHLVCIASVTLAELYRGVGRSSALDSLLARMDDLLTRDTDPSFARLVGAVLHDAGAGSVLLADAHAVAAVVEGGGGVVLTADPDDLERLAASHPRIVVVPL